MEHNKNPPFLSSPMSVYVTKFQQHALNCTIAYWWSHIYLPTVAGIGTGWHTNAHLICTTTFVHMMIQLCASAFNLLWSTDRLHTMKYYAYCNAYSSGGVNIDTCVLIIVNPLYINLYHLNGATCSFLKHQNMFICKKVAVILGSYMFFHKGKTIMTFKWS